MSSYNIYSKDYLSIKENIDKIIICMSNKDMLNRKIGIGKKPDKKDIDLFLYIYDFLNDRYCNTIIEDNCFMDKLNALYYKYK